MKKSGYNFGLNDVLGKFEEGEKSSAALEEWQRGYKAIHSLNIRMLGFLFGSGIKSTAQSNQLLNFKIRVGIKGTLILPI